MKISKIISLVVFALIIPFLINAQEKGVVSPKVSFSEKSELFLSVYAMRYTSNDGVFGVFIDRRGTAQAPFQIAKTSVGEVDLNYIPNGDRFLVVYIDRSNGYTVAGRVVGSNGNFLSDVFPISTSNPFSISSLRVVPSVDGNGFLVMWLDNRTRMGVQIYARFVSRDGALLGDEILVEKNAYGILRFDLSLNTDDGNYLMTYVENQQGVYSVYGRLIDSNLTPSRAFKISDTQDYDAYLSVVYNQNRQNFLVVWSDYLIGVGSYNIKGAILNKDTTIISGLDITKDNISNISNRFPELSYNIFSKNYIVVFATAMYQGLVSNVNVVYIDEDGMLLNVFSIDDTNKLVLLTPAIASNDICGNEEVVFAMYDTSNKENVLGMKLLGNLCSFKLSVSKKGDGDGVVSSNPAGIDCGNKCSAMFDDGTKVTISAVPLESSLFSSFTGMECVDEPVCTINMDSDKSIEVEFLLKTFDITTSAGQGGMIQPDSAKVKYGGEQRFDIVPDNGYAIEDVLVDNQSIGAVGSYTFTDVKDSHTLSAIFKQAVEYTISASSSEGGIISPSGDIKVLSGGNITFTMTANNGYYLSAVEVDTENIGSVSEYTFSNVNSNHTIFAKFEPYLNEWDMDAGTDVSKENTDIPTTITDTKETGSGCGCNLLE